MHVSNREQALVTALQAVVAEADAMELRLVAAKASEALDQFWYAKCRSSGAADVRDQPS